VTARAPRAARAPRVGAILAALLALAGCSTSSVGAGTPGSTVSAAPSPEVSKAAVTSASTPSDPGSTTAPPAGDRSAGTSAPPGLTSTSGVTSTPGLQLAGPQPLPAAVHLTPTRVRIPAIGVDSALEELHTKAGVLQPPTDPLVAGWWSGGPVPGNPGPAVIAGHLDSYTGPAVFIHLSELSAGDLIDVTRSNGSTVAFVVDSVDVYQKSAFPTQAVYGATPGVALRLITCGGTFDRAKQVYLANVIVYASLQT
jgi:hypothetical protein